mgnify:CR=1 FL=1
MKLSFRWYGKDDKVTLENIRQIPGMYSVVTAVYDVLKEKTNDKTKIYLLNDFDRVLSLDLVEGAKKLNESAGEPAELDDFAKYVEEQIALRVEAKKAKNFAEADRIRDELASKGVTLLDTREGTKWSKE